MTSGQMWMVMFLCSAPTDQPCELKKVSDCPGLWPFQLSHGAKATCLPGLWRQRQGSGEPSPK